MKKFLSVLSVIVVCLLVITGCPTGNDDPAGNRDGIKVKFQFMNKKKSPSSSMRSAVRAAEMPASDESLAGLNEFYANIGNRTGVYTPTEFNLHINWVYIFNSSSSFFLLGDPKGKGSDLYANFIEPIIVESAEPIKPGTYTGMYFDFNEEFDSQASIKVKIPGGYQYTWQDTFSKSDNGGNFGPEQKFVKLYDDDVYQIVPNFLQPYQSNRYFSNVQGEEIRPFRRMNAISTFLFTGNTFKAVLTGLPGYPEGWDVTEYLPSDSSTEFRVAGGSFSALTMPFEEIIIPITATGVKFEIRWDLEGIIEVYDNNTPNEKNDDFVVLANKFWERFSVVPIIDYEAGINNSDSIPAYIVGTWIANSGNFHGYATLSESLSFILNLKADETWTASLGDTQFDTGTYTYNLETRILALQSSNPTSSTSYNTSVQYNSGTLIKNNNDSNYILTRQ